MSVPTKACLEDLSFYWLLWMLQLGCVGLAILRSLSPNSLFLGYGLKLSRRVARAEAALSLSDFVQQSDSHLFDSISGLVRLMDQADVKLINSSTSLKDLHEALERLNLLDEERLRPSWDQYFMQLASLAAHRSNCMKRRVGCVLVREKRVVSTGYNGTPRNLQNCNEGGCWCTYSQLAT